MVLAEELEFQSPTYEQESQACEEALLVVGQALKPVIDTNSCLTVRDICVPTWAVLPSSNGPPTNGSLFLNSPPNLVTLLAHKTDALLCIYRI